MSEAATTPWSLVDADIAERVRQLELFSRFRVESFLHGPNRSPFKGFAAEFKQHRPYFRGDNLRFLDWRVYGKSERLFVREFEETTNARISVILDVSNSMRYSAAEGVMSKHDFAVRCAALIFYLATLHRDSISLTLFNTQVVSHTPFTAGRGHMMRIFRELLASEPGEATDFVASMRSATARIRRRGLTVVISDFMDDADTIVPVISRLRFEGSDVIAMQIYDPSEQDIDFNAVTRFHDLESNDIITIDPMLLRREYQKEFETHTLEVKTACQSHGFDHVALGVAEDYDVPLLEYVRRRMELFT